MKSFVNEQVKFLIEMVKNKIDMKVLEDSEEKISTLLDKTIYSMKK